MSEYMPNRITKLIGTNNFQGFSFGALSAILVIVCGYYIETHMNVYASVFQGTSFLQIRLLLTSILLGVSIGDIIGRYIHSGVSVIDYIIGGFAMVFAVFWLYHWKIDILTGVTILAFLISIVSNQLELPKDYEELDYVKDNFGLIVSGFTGIMTVIFTIISLAFDDLQNIIIILGWIFLVIIVIIVLGIIVDRKERA